MTGTPDLTTDLHNILNGPASLMTFFYSFVDNLSRPAVTFVFDFQSGNTIF